MLPNPGRAIAGFFPASFKEELSPIKEKLLKEVSTRMKRLQDSKVLSESDKLLMVPIYEKLLEDIKTQI